MAGAPGPLGPHAVQIASLTGEGFVSAQRRKTEEDIAGKSKEKEEKEKKA